MSSYVGRDPSGPGGFGIIRYIMKQLQRWLAKQSTLWVGFIVLVVAASWLAVISLNQKEETAPTGPADPPAAPIEFGPVVDDWSYDPATASPESFPGSGTPLGVSTRVTSVPAISADAASSNLGFAVGGANDISNFRQNVAAGFLPSPADLSHEGIFYDYFFDTGQTQECEELFCPSYTTAVSPDPFSGQNDYFLSVGLNSNISADDFARPDLDLVVVLDISGSMSSPLDSYYYDGLGQRVARTDQAEGPSTKMVAASRSLVALLDHLRPQDRLGVVLFDDQSYIAKPLGYIGEADTEVLAGHILELTPQGGTNMEAGYTVATKMLTELPDDDPDERESRIIFLTDAMPNTGNTSRSGLTQLAADNADDSIYTSFIGIGLDFNADLVSSITQTRGANYHAVHSTADFVRRLDEGFEYMVTPLVFDLSLKLEAAGYDIKAVYGSPEADLATGEIMRVNTLFPSLTVDGQTRGGLILLQLEKTSNDTELSLTVDYQDRQGQTQQNSQTIEFSTSDGFDNSGIHKGVVLARTVNALRDWLRYESSQASPDQPRPPIIASDDYRRGGIPVILEPLELGYWEWTSRSLRLSAAYRPVLSSLRDYLSVEIEKIADDSLEQELDLLDLILGSDS